MEVAGGTTFQFIWLPCCTRQQTPIVHCHLPPSFTFHQSFRSRGNSFKQFFSTKAKLDDLAELTCESLSSVSSTSPAAVKEEAKAALSSFLSKHGIENEVVERTVNMSAQFIDHLVSRLQALQDPCDVLGSEFKRLEIKDVLAPYLESMLEEHGDFLIDAVEKFPNPPAKKSVKAKKRSWRKKNVIVRVSMEESKSLLPPNIIYLMDLGLDLDRIKKIIRRYPYFAYYSMEQKFKPLVKFLLDLGVDPSALPTILHRRPQLCGLSIEKNIIPTMAFLEELGVDRKQWAKVINRNPGLLTYSRQKITASVDYLTELGISDKNIGKVLVRFPQIACYNVDAKLRPTEKYFRSLGIDVAALVTTCPETFGFSLEANIKPTTEFFLDKGYTMDDLRTMVSRHRRLYSCSTATSLIPKWEFFLSMDYPKSELVNFPIYFSFSLEKRIKPRYVHATNHGVCLSLRELLSFPQGLFERLVEKKMEIDP